MQDGRREMGDTGGLGKSIKMGVVVLESNHHPQLRD